MGRFMLHAKIFGDRRGTEKIFQSNLKGLRLIKVHNC